MSEVELHGGGGHTGSCSLAKAIGIGGRNTRECLGEGALTAIFASWPQASKSPVWLLREEQQGSSASNVGARTFRPDNPPENDAVNNGGTLAAAATLPEASFRSPMQSPTAPSRGPSIGLNASAPTLSPLTSFERSISPRLMFERDLQGEAYYSEPERDVPRSSSPPDFFPRHSTIGATSAVEELLPERPRPPTPLEQKARHIEPAKIWATRGGSTPGVPRGCIAERSTSSSSLWEVNVRERADSDPGALEGIRAVSRKQSGEESPSRGADGIHRKSDGSNSGLSFADWLSSEVQSHPDEAQLGRVPHSHLAEVALTPRRLEPLLLIGFLLCLDILLYELTYTLLQVARALPQLLGRMLGALCCSCHRRSRGRSNPKREVLTVTQQGDMIRLSLLILNVMLVHAFFDVSGTYHYIRGESFLKLYVIFNMLEMFERWCRSFGVDMFDLIMASVREPWSLLIARYAATLVYCFMHSSMHLVRVLLLNVAINTSSNAVFLIIVTNNFGEIKSTVFKRYEAKSLFPIIASDIVERFYLLADILFVVTQRSISARTGVHSRADVSFWLFLLVGLELGTDWIKFCLIMKFSDLPASTMDVYKEVLLADVLLCRTAHGGRGVDALNVPSVATSRDKASSVPAVPFRGIHSFSHCLQRRLGFSGVPLTTIVVCHLVMLARAPCSVALQLPQATLALVVVAGFVLGLLAKILLGIVIVGFAARRRGRISRGLELFPKIKSL